LGPVDMGHHMHVVRTVTQRAAAEYNWANWPERKIGVTLFQCFPKLGQMKLRKMCVSDKKF